MQLTRAHITDYRCVEDSDTFTIEPTATCLVGKNESGKTAVLQSLFRLNPIEKTAFDDVIDFPGRFSRRLKNDPRGRDPSRLSHISAKR